MGLPIERWARNAAILETPPKRLLDDLGDLAHYERQFWRRKAGDLIAAGDPTALLGGVAGLNAVPPSAALAEMASANATQALWTSSIFTPIPANTVQAPQAFRILATGKVTTSTAPGGQGWDPRVGEGSTVNAAIKGTTLGASTKPELTASITGAFWTVMGDLTIRSVGAAGANSVIVGYFAYVGTQATASGLAGPAVVGAGHNLMFGGTAASVDLSVAGGFSLGTVNTVTTIKYTVDQIHWPSWN